MKKIKNNLIAGIGILVISLFSISCGGGGDEQSDADKDGGGETPLEKQLIGYWSPDADSFFEMAKSMMPAEVVAVPEALEAAKEQSAAMAEKMVIQFDGSKSMMYGPGPPESSTYKITSSDSATKTMTADITDADGKVEKGTVIVNGDSIVLIKKEGEKEERIKFNRITEAQFKERVPQN